MGLFSGIPILGDLTGANAADAANRNFKRASAIDKQRYEDEKAFQAVLDRILQSGEATGQWDFESQAKQYDKEWSQGLDQSLQSVGAGLRIAGIKPGDSYGPRQIGSVTARAVTDRAHDLSEMRRNLLLQRLQAYLSTRNPGVAQTANNLASRYTANAQRLGQQSAAAWQGMTGLFGAAMPWIMPERGTQ